MHFSSLPHDILRDIFMKTRTIRGSRTQIPTVIMLSQVAPFTRRIVYNEALLWTEIDDQVLNNLAYLYLHLDLSRHCPLDIRFHPVLGDRTDGSYPLSNFMPLLVHSDRWRRLVIGSWSMRVLSATVNMLKYVRPQMLEELIVMWDAEVLDPDSDEEDEDDICIFFQCGAPCLKKLSLTGVRCIPSITRDLTDLQLTCNFHFDLPLWSYSDFVKIISKMISLTNISMDWSVVRVGRRAITNPKTIALPNLQSLVIVAHGGEVENCRYLAAMLALFSSAPLKSVDFYHDYSSGDDVRHIITHLRSGRIQFHQATTLVVELQSWTEDDVRRFIQVFPSVERLYFRWPTNGRSNILDALINAPNTEDLCPRLHAIYLAHVGDPGPVFVLHQVRQLAESRIASGNPFRELWIRQKSGMRSACEDIDWLHEHVQVQWVSSDDLDGIFPL
ncbi:hypothetical protein FIBSPDRAFT_59237 [Athelia psychrophila]|uniref:F-box domain-containing protein n=1 Tax=Athelia psychrophila TaxID=1759441 RepID=A0A166F3C9_9AGAM|nr:hypothetical protein FIBSPDRAFT_59237 [Fibularhizoctonia sp. CBS 109695]